MDAFEWGAVASGAKDYDPGSVARPGATTQTDCLFGERYVFSKWVDAETGVYLDSANPMRVEMDSDRAIEAVYRKTWCTF